MILYTDIRIIYIYIFIIYICMHIRLDWIRLHRYLSNILSPKKMSFFEVPRVLELTNIQPPWLRRCFDSHRAHGGVDVGRGAMATSTRPWWLRWGNHGPMAQ
jgi:hypothetical protein